MNLNARQQDTDSSPSIAISPAPPSARTGARLAAELVQRAAGRWCCAVSMCITPKLCHVVAGGAHKWRTNCTNRVLGPSRTHRPTGKGVFLI
jgi:hypothetical protein